MSSECSDATEGIAFVVGTKEVTIKTIWSGHDPRQLPGGSRTITAAIVNELNRSAEQEWRHMRL